MAIKNHIQIAGGSKSGFASVTLKERELGYCLDTNELYIGNSSSGSLKNQVLSNILVVSALPTTDVQKTVIYRLTATDGDNAPGLYYYNNENVWQHLAEGETVYSAIGGLPKENANLKKELEKLEWQIQEDGTNSDFEITRGTYTSIDDTPVTKIKLKVIDDSLSTSTIKTYSIDKIVEMIQTMSTKFWGSFDTVADLKAASIEPDNNDTAVVKADEDHDSACTLYQFVATDSKKPKVGTWVYKYTINSQTVAADDETIADLDSSVKGLKFGFKKFDSTKENNVWRVQNDGSWALNDLSDKQDALTFVAGAGITIDTTTTKNTVNITLADSTDLGSWD